jgi:hypothetical protein
MSDMLQDFQNFNGNHMPFTPAWMYQNPGDAGNQYVQKIPGVITPYYQPYIDAGNKSLSTLQGQDQNLLGNYQGLQNQYTQQMTNPGATLSQIGAGYQASPGYQWNLDQGEAAITNAAAAGGMLGTPQQQQYAGTLASNLANQDYNQYMQSALGVQQRGTQGAQHLYDTGYRGEQDINHMGYQASNQLAEGLAQALMAQAHLAYQGMASRNAYHESLAKGVFGAAGNIVGHFL